MNPTTPSQSAAYWDILMFLLFLGLALVVYLLIRRASRNALKSQDRIFGLFLLRLSLPAIFLAAAFIFKIGPLRMALSFTSQFYKFLDAAIVFFLFFLLLRFIDAGLFSWFQKKSKPFPMPRVLHGSILVVLYLTILLAVLKGRLGVNITGFLTTSVILTAILGLALQGVLSNVLAGMSLNFTNSFSRGDWIRIGEYEGVVLDTNWRETLLRDRASNVIIIPNNAVASATIINYTRMYPETAVTIPIKVCASAPSSEVLAAIKEACREVPEILSLPEPRAYILSYDQFGISYLAKFWVTDYEQKDIIITEIGRLIWYKFQRRGISVPVAVEEQVKEVLDTFQEKRAVSAAEEEREKTYTDLVRSDFLRYQEGERAGEMIVSEDELRDLASLVRRETFGRGEVLFRQGEKGDSCYVVAAGLIRGEIVYEENAKRFTSEFRVGTGGIFGEMSLFTGMPRTATGIVEADAELLQISSESFAHLISRNTKLAEVIAEIVSNRNLKNQEFLKKIKELSLKDLEAASSKKSILERLLRLVHLGKKR